MMSSILASTAVVLVLGIATIAKDNLHFDTFMGSNSEALYKGKIISLAIIFGAAFFCFSQVLLGS